MRTLRETLIQFWNNIQEVEKMLSYNQSGFSLDAKVRIESWDKDGLERLIRYCARTPFASENLRWNGRLALLAKLR